MNINQIYNEDYQEGIKRIPDASIDCILTDPPYLYLKGQKLERPFDEHALFAEFKRVLKPDGFVVLFGRGTSFYRWNTILAELGFVFKEEVIWNKAYITSPLLPLLRVHESISILHNTESLKAVEDFLINNAASYKFDRISGYNVSAQPGFKNEDRCAAVVRSMSDGCTERSIIRTDLHKDEKANKQGLHGDMKIGDRACNVISSVECGMNEKSIIKIVRNHYSAIHPTQKPVRLIERLLALTTQSDDVVLDPFIGSCSTAIACVNTNRKYIGFEIDKEYYDAGIKRLNEVLSEPKLAI